MGDLNFRLLEQYDKSPEEIERMVKKGEICELLLHDQLKNIMESGEAFSELQEGAFEFAPTFKYEVGTSEYNLK